MYLSYISFLVVVVQIYMGKSIGTLTLTEPLNHTLQSKPPQRIAQQEGS